MSDLVSPAKNGPGQFDGARDRRIGPDDCENLQDRRKPAIELDKNQRLWFVSRTRPGSLRLTTFN
jgi:hypothetical protein